MPPQFKDEVMSTVKSILEHFQDSVAFMTIRPIVNLVMPHFEETVEKKPEEVYGWLQKAKVHIDRAITIYEEEHENRAKP